MKKVILFSILFLLIIQSYGHSNVQSSLISQSSGLVFTRANVWDDGNIDYGYPNMLSDFIDVRNAQSVKFSVSQPINMMIVKYDYNKFIICKDNNMSCNSSVKTMDLNGVGYIRILFWDRPNYPNFGWYAKFNGYVIYSKNVFNIGPKCGLTFFDQNVLDNGDIENYPNKLSEVIDVANFATLKLQSSIPNMNFGIIQYDSNQRMISKARGGWANNSTIQEDISGAAYIRLLCWDRPSNDLVNNSKWNLSLIRSGNTFTSSNTNTQVFSKNDLIGTWKVADQNGTSYIEFYADGTYKNERHLVPINYGTCIEYQVGTQYGTWYPNIYGENVDITLEIDIKRSTFSATYKNVSLSASAFEAKKKSLLVEVAKRQDRFRQYGETQKIIHWYTGGSKNRLVAEGTEILKVK